MSSQAATVFCLTLIFYLFWIDREKNEGVSKAIWIPFIWMFFSGTRELSLWLNLREPGDITEGQPYDRALYIILMVIGFTILIRRKLNWKELLYQNAWIWLFFVFGALSIFWSDYPIVSFKRWLKAIGLVVMALVILTEERPFEALGTVLRRLAFLCLPISILFIKYYPHLGRAYHNFTGTQMFTGVAMQKNGLGKLCLIFAIYFLWNLLFNRYKGLRQLHISIYLIILPMIVLLLHMANSATSLACTVIAILIFAIGRFPIVSQRPHRILVLVVTCIVLFGILEIGFEVKNSVIAMLGRRPDLTTRVPMWEELLSMVRNPIVGFGYDSFWLGERRQIMIDNWGIGMQAHNGYLDMYLNLGLIGLLFIVCWILSALRKVTRHLMINYRVAILRICIIVVVAFYSWTETTFAGVNILWLLFFLAVVEVPSNQAS